MSTKRKQYPSQARLRELFDYYTEGFLVWKYRPEKSKAWNSRWGGTRAGSSQVLANRGYRCNIIIDGISYNCIHIIYVYHKGDVPDGLYVKCRGNIYSGNKIEDMHLSDRRNSTHAGKRVDSNLTGFIGVSKSRSGYFRAAGGCEKKYLGTYETPEAAASAYDDWAKRQYGDGFIGNNSGCFDFYKYRIKKSCKHQQKKKKPSSGYFGVTSTGNEKKPWRSTIKLNGRKTHLGVFACAEQAARAYNIAAYEHYGEHAILNDIPDPLGKLQADEEDVF